MNKSIGPLALCTRTGPDMPPFHRIPACVLVATTIHARFLLANLPEHRSRAIQNQAQTPWPNGPAVAIHAVLLDFLYAACHSATAMALPPRPPLTRLHGYLGSDIRLQALEV